MISQKYLSYDEPLKTKIYDDFSGGMISDPASGRVDASALLLNMETKGQRLVSSRKPMAVSFDGGFDTGPVTASHYADGIFLFRKGQTLYAHKDGNFSEIAKLTEDHGEIYDDGTFFYIVDGENILSLSRDLQLTTVAQTVPVCFTGLSRSGAYFTEIAPMNPFCRYIDVWLSDEAGNEQIFPPSWAVDPTYARAWHPDGREVYPGYMMLRADRIIFDGDNAKGCRLRLRLLDADDENTYSFSCAKSYRTLLDAPQSAHLLNRTDGHTLLLLAKDTAIYGISLENGFASHSWEQVKTLDCLRHISGLIPFDDGFLVFFEDAVKKLSVVRHADDFSLSLLPFKYDFGSDMPQSIVYLDDKIVFASSRGGICCIDRFGVSEKLGCRSVFANIADGDYGFFSHTAEEYRQAAAFAAFGKYYLTVGDLTYVWDYRVKLPSAAQTRKQEESMVWSLSDILCAEKYLACFDGKLYYTEKDSHVLCVLDGTDGEYAPCKMTTAQLDLGSVGQKILLECGLRYRADHAVRISLSCDGLPYMDEYIFPKSGCFTQKSFRIPGKRFEKLSLTVSSEGAFSADALIFHYFA